MTRTPTNPIEPNTTKPLSKVEVWRLPVIEPPIPDGGGRILGVAGELTQVVNGPSFRFLCYLEFQPNAPRLRGNHYHNRKTETLYVITGELHARYRDLDTDETADVRLAAGNLVTIAPRCAHAYYPVRYSQALEITADAYDPDDTTPYEVASLDAFGPPDTG